jgi:hypothetical protein
MTNLTWAEVITPLLVASHKKGVSLFSLGEPASDELVAIAEGGDIQPMSDALLMSGKAYATATNGALLQPGETTTINVETKKGFNYVSVAPTNDGFISLNGVRGPKGKRVVSYVSPAYDAGSETNDKFTSTSPVRIVVEPRSHPTIMARDMSISTAASMEWLI